MNKLILDEEMTEFVKKLVMEKQISLEEEKETLKKITKEWIDDELMSRELMSRILLGGDNE